ncbi:MAG: hypothetical protein ACRDON_01720 [Gaiellaceae bacterium]
MSERPQVSWKAIEARAAVCSSDGTEVGRVREISGDSEADIFSGLVVSVGALGPDRFVPAERVSAIWPDRVEVAATAEEIASLPEYEEPVAERWAPSNGVLTRVRRFLRGR